MQTIAVIDYGMGNLRSVTKALEHVTDQKIILTDNLDEIVAADRIVFPGQGAARDCMKSIDDCGLRDVIVECEKTKPFLGICMGMQVLMHHSEENQGTACLGVFDGHVTSFAKDLKEKGETLKVPHMGWNQVKQVKQHALWEGIPDNARFYFVHSYYLDVIGTELHAGTCHYGHDFSAVIAKDNVFAMQCHPEKSAEHGLQLLKNFTNWDGQA
ncbi:MAG: imidazole glycerol phosphate synthase subunit HisH [Gammaproteobacteria bacterium]|nr:imidazole glycerol phosphate synthase subunit HisH [Gammaproteobacteria bacterium]